MKKRILLLLVVITTMIKAQQTAPYFENFDGVTAPDLSNCWTTINDSTDPNAGFVVETNLYSDAISSPNVAHMMSGFDTTAKVMLVSPLLDDLSQNKRITLHARRPPGSGDFAWSIGYLSDPTDVNTFTPIVNYPIGFFNNNDDWETITINFTNYQAAYGKYIAISQSQQYNNGNLVIDDFNYTVNPTATIMTAELNKITVYPNPAVNFITIKATEKITSIKIINILGQEVLNKTNLIILPNINYQIDINNLPKGLYLLQINSKLEQIKFIKK